MAEMPLTSAKHLKRQSPKISAGQRVCKVSMSSHNVVGTCKVCVKPYDGGPQRTKKLLSLQPVLSPKKGKETIMQNSNLLHKANKGNIHEEWNRKPTFDLGQGRSLENVSTETTLNQRATIVYRERNQRSNKNKSSKQKEKYVRRI